MREKAWNIYFATGDREPLIRAYSDSIRGIAWHRYPKQSEDMHQVGLIGLLKAIDTLDLKRVKSIDSWVWMNVRSAMFNARQFKPTVSLDQLDFDWLPTLEDQDTNLDVKIALEKDSLDDAREYLSNYEPTKQKTEIILQRYQRGEISLRQMALDLGVSRRQAYKLLDSLPDSW